MFIKSIDIGSGKDLDAFIDLPFRLYKNDPNWAPPFRRSLKKLLKTASGMQLAGGPYALFMVINNDIPVARLVVGINQVKNAQRGKNEGYYSLFECINDLDAAKLLFDAARDWLKSQSADVFTGPVSPTDGDDDRGVLISGYDELPAVNTTHTKDYYPALLEAVGFEKHLDFYAFRLENGEANFSRMQKISARLNQRSRFTLRPFNLSDIVGEARSVYEVYVASILPHWEHLEVPSEKQILDQITSLKPYMRPELIVMGFCGGKPAGFIAAIPDYNQVLKRIGGRLGPLGLLKLLYYKRKITRIRVFMQFVAPEFQRSALIYLMYTELYKNFKALGYTEMESSTVAEFNRDSLSCIRGAGFVESRRYRIYSAAV
jgi:hypothetical protein